MTVALVCAVSVVWPGFSVVERMGFLAAATFMVRGANDAWSWLTVDATGITRRRLLFSRRIEFADVAEVRRRRHGRGGDELVYRPQHGLALRVYPGAFVSENQLRRALREATEAAHLTWP